MKYHHIKKTLRQFFEGWYVKHQKNDQTVAFIPGVNITAEGEKNAFLQMITNDASYFIPYDFEAFFVSSSQFYVKLADSAFSENGAVINIQTPDLYCSGWIRYGSFTPPSYPIMGPFSMLPRMECNHGVISLKHDIDGEININGRRLDLTGGNGYIEKDWGSSFPKAYTWLHCNDFCEENCSIMVAIAEIPYGGLSFRGLTAIVQYKDRQYRFATYNGGKVLYTRPNEILLQKGKYRLHVAIKTGANQPLKAPAIGSFSRIIREHAACSGHFLLTYGQQPVFDLKSDNVSYEIV